MGRPSLAGERVAQVVDAYGVVLAEFGVEGATLARVSEVCGLSPSHIRHYVGSFEQVPVLFHERLLDEYVRFYEELVVTFPAGERARGLVSGFFGSSPEVTSGQRAVIAAVAMAGTSPPVGDRVLAGFSRLVACFASALSNDAPSRDSREASATAYEMLSLLFGHWVLRGVGFSRELQPGVIAQALTMVDAFISGAPDSQHEPGPCVGGAR